MDNSYRMAPAQHCSQTDNAKGFGGKFGVLTDRKDKTAEGYGYHEKVVQHSSQKGLHSLCYGIGRSILYVFI